MLNFGHDTVHVSVLGFPKDWCPSLIKRRWRDPIGSRHRNHLLNFWQSIVICRITELSR